MPAKSLEQVRNLCMRRGFVFPGSAAYGGVASFWDYGPLGAEILNNVKRAWWQDAVYSRDDMEGLDAAILMSRKVWQHSGHEATFSDPMVDCKECRSRFRADHIAGVCPKCGSKQFTEPRRFNLMFQSHVGPVEADKGTEEELASRVYLRPETAQGIFMNFAHVQRAMARKIPFGIAQMGKAFRNEITPGNFIFRTREFEQMEIEFFIKPAQFAQPGEKNDEQWHAEWVDQRFRWWLRYATPPSAENEEMEATEARFRKRAQTADELAHYAKATTDIEYLFPGALGWGEIEGVANRTDFDLSAHSKDVPEADLKRLKLEPNTDSVEKFDYFDPDLKQRYIPWVIEPSAGVTRAVLTFLCEAYHEELVKEPTKQEIDQIKSDEAMIRKNAEKKIKEAEKDIKDGKEPKHDPVKVAAFLEKFAEVVSRLPESLDEVLPTLDHEGAQNLELVKKFRVPTEKFIEDCMRTVLRLHPALAPIKLAVFPLKKNKPELVELAQSIKQRFQKHFRTVYDDSAGIGKLYRRQDEIGTPFCITVDFESLEDRTVTVRERDSMAQERVAIDDLPEYLSQRLEA
jgi:glycyl-tRNA synthetase